MKIREYQIGGEMSAQQVQEPQAPAQDPIMELVQIFSESLQNGSCEGLAAGAQMFLELVAQASGQGPAPIGPDSGTQPVFKKGGSIVRRVKKGCKK